MPHTILDLLDGGVEGGRVLSAHLAQTLNVGFVVRAHGL